MDDQNLGNNLKAQVNWGAADTHSHTATFTAPVRTPIKSFMEGDLGP